MTVQESAGVCDAVARASGVDRKIVESVVASMLAIGVVVSTAPPASASIFGETQLPASASPDLKQFISYFCRAWQGVYGAKYFWSGGKDAKLAKRILAWAGSLANAKQIVDRYFEDRSEFVLNNSHSIGLLSSRLNCFRGLAPEGGDGFAPTVKLTSAELRARMPELFEGA